MIAIGSVRAGALLVSENARDFEKLATVLPLRFVTVQRFSTMLEQ